MGHEWAEELNMLLIFNKHYLFICWSIDSVYMASAMILG